MKKAYKIITWIAVSLTVLTCLWIMFFRLGLVPALDFGAGAYYYADIPEFEKYTGDGAFSTQIPLWVYILLFLLWGWLVWRLWVKIEKK